MTLYKAVMEDDKHELSEHYIEAINKEEATEIAEMLADQLGYIVCFVESAATLLINYTSPKGKLKYKLVDLKWSKRMKQKIDWKWFKNLWKKNANQYEYWDMIIKSGIEITFSEWDRAWQYCIINHPDYKQAKVEFEMAINGWY